MDETGIVKLFVFIGIVAIILNIFSLDITQGLEGKMFRDFVVPSLCLKENSTFFLSTPTSDEFCKKIFENDIDVEMMKSLCVRHYNYDTGHKSCIGIASLYEKRIEECTTYILKRDERMTSVEDSDVEKFCNEIINMSLAGSPTGSLIQEIFQDTVTRKIIE